MFHIGEKFQGNFKQIEPTSIISITKLLHFIVPANDDVLHSIPKIRYPRHYWDDFFRHRSFMHELAEKLNISDTKGLYSLTSQMIRLHGGNSLLEKYNGSVSKLLAAVYPSYKHSCRELVMNVMKDLKMKKVDDLVHAPVEYPYTTNLIFQSYLNYTSSTYL